MPDPITFPLSEYQRAYFTAIATEERSLAEKRNAATTAIVTSTHPASAFTGWSINITDAGIVCTPPAESSA